MEQDHKYKGLSEKDAQHQKEWDDWFAKYFNEKGEYIENKDEGKSILNDIVQRKNSKNLTTSKISTTEEQQRSFG